MLFARLENWIEKIFYPQHQYQVKKEKEFIRRDISQQRRALTSEKIVAQSALIMEKIEKSEEFKRARNILVYHPIHNEVKVSDLTQKWSKEKNFLLPTVVGNKIIVKYYKGEDNLKAGRYGIMEPNSDKFKGIPDLIILPAVAYDRQLNRLGRGKGYYDRLLVNYKRSVTFGVAYDFQIIDNLPTTPLDKKVNKIFTPNEIIS